MQAAKSYFAEQGWAIEDVSANRLYDLVCHRGVEELRVEVMDTTTAGDSILLTKNEVAHAMEDPMPVIQFLAKLRVPTMPRFRRIFYCAWGFESLRARHDRLSGTFPVNAWGAALTSF